MESLAPDIDENNLHKTGPVSAYHHYVLSSILPDAQQEFLCMQKKNKALEKENEIFKKKVESLVTDCEQFKAERQRIHNVIKNRDHQRNQLLHCKNELSALGKKMAFQQTELKREHKQNETVKEELESVKKELQSVKQGAFTQRTEQQHLKQQLDQVVKERDILNDALLRCKLECSELREKICYQQSSANKKDCQCKKQMKEIHFLNLEKQTLEKERCITESNAEEQKQELRKCEKDLQTQKEKFKESKKMQEKGKKIAIIQESPRKIKQPRQKVPHPKVQSLQKELLAQAEELRATQKLCEELKKKVTEVAVQFEQCQATIRDQKEKLKAVTAERNMYRSLTETLGTELVDIKKAQRSEKQLNKATKRAKKVKVPSEEKSKGSHLPPTSSKVQMQSDLRIMGKKL
ncbi:cilia- and flagella-associated protein 58-like [Trematomus bernacchii]|uniref:cilia- and flagella-associated protein 58-like n=1 Tax=Trematomus bernacchii TaxID=40690 RepID=UPI00146C51A2|nr:cilia- and flagella-associated protein 58-like [Trematomus bernacchii]